MPAPDYDEIWDEAIDDVDEMFGEDLILEPRARPVVNGRADVNGRTVPDTNRETSTFRASYRAVGSMQNARGRAMADSTTMAVAADSPSLRLTIPGEGFSRPQTGDIVQRVATGERFRVTAVLERRQNSLEIPLARIGAAA